MRKLTIFAAGIIVTATVLLSTGAMAAESKNERPDAAEQVILRLLYQPTKKAIEDYYGEHKQYWEQEVINIQKIPESPYWEVVIQAETFHGAHNPPYGLETMTFYIGPFDEVQLISFDHQDEAD